MKFCPLCFRILLIQSSTSGNRLICKICRYFFPLTRQQKVIVKYGQQQKLQIFQQGQQIKELPITQTMCPVCSCKRAYYEQRQTRSADQASTLFFTCVDCGHKWNQN